MPNIRKKMVRVRDGKGWREEPRYWFRYRDAEGNQPRRTFKRLEEAKDALAKVQHDLRAGIYVRPPPAGRPSGSTSRSGGPTRSSGRRTPPTLWTAT